MASSGRCKMPDDFSADGKHKFEEVRSTGRGVADFNGEIRSRKGQRTMPKCLIPARAGRLPYWGARFSRV